MKKRRFANPNNDGRDIHKKFFWETDKEISQCSCPMCVSLKTKILHDNFRLGVIVGFGS